MWPKVCKCSTNSVNTVILELKNYDVQSKEGILLVTRYIENVTEIFTRIQREAEEQKNKQMERNGIA